MDRHQLPIVSGVYRAAKARRRDAFLRRLPEGGVCAEIGVYKGDFSARILTLLEPARLHLIDPWRYETAEDYRHTVYGGARGVGQLHMDMLHEAVLRRFAREIERGVVAIHRASSAEAAALFPDGHFDWVYIDGNHLYEFVSEDLRLYCPKLRQGGLITGDDYREGGRWQGGVKRAVDEFLARGACEMVEIRDQQFVLRRL